MSTAERAREALVLAIARANFDKQMRDDCPAGEEPGGEHTSLREWPTLESARSEIHDTYLDEARAYLGHIERAGLRILPVEPPVSVGAKKAEGARLGTVSIERGHAWEYCCGVRWTTTCRVLTDDREGVAIFNHRIPDDPNGMLIRCNQCGGQLQGLQRIRAAERMVGSAIGQADFRIWPVGWDEFDAAAAAAIDAAEVAHKRAS